LKRRYQSSHLAHHSQDAVHDVRRLTPGRGPVDKPVSLAEYFRNSLIVSTVATVLSVAIALFAAYPLARLRFRGGRVFSVVVLSTQMFPGILFLLPLFLLYRQIQRGSLRRWCRGSTVMMPWRAG
jgi:ABC-type glycerol-3-phosphate transport system permease component